MKLDPEQFDLLLHALKDAFGIRDLGLMLRVELGKDLEDIVLPENRPRAIEELISSAEKGDWIRDLLIAARSYQPGNRMLRDAAERMLGNASGSFPTS